MERAPLDAMTGRTRSLSTVALLTLTLLAGLASAVGCADTDPSYGPPGIIKGREVDFGLPAAPPAEAGPSTKNAADPFAAWFTSLMGTCTPCHVAASLSPGAPPFM